MAAGSGGGGGGMGGPGGEAAGAGADAAVAAAAAGGGSDAAGAEGAGVACAKAVPETVNGKSHAASSVGSNRNPAGLPFIRALLSQTEADSIKP